MQYPPLCGGGAEGDEGYDRHERYPKLIAEPSVGFGVCQLFAFGSVPREYLDAASDIDALVEFLPKLPTRLFHIIIRLHRALKDLLGRPVDAVRMEDLEPVALPRSRRFA